MSSILKYHNPFPSFRSEFQLLYHVRQFQLMIINFAASLQHNNNNILCDVPVYEFNSNIFISSDNDLKRPLATVFLCTYTHTKSIKFLVYIFLRKQVKPSTICCNILQIFGGKVTWQTMVASK